jgi:hypothetical protein
VAERRIVTAIREDQDHILDSRGLKPVVSVPTGAKLVRVSGLSVGNGDGALLGGIVPPMPSVMRSLSVGVAVRNS